jgi:hypothetical protein
MLIISPLSLFFYFPSFLESSFKGRNACANKARNPHSFKAVGSFCTILYSENGR